MELVSHYGKQHFCPISLFRVFGNSEYEVLDIEDARSGSTSATEEDSTEEEMLIELTTNRSDDQDKGVTVTEGSGNSGRNLFGSAKDAVINIVKKAAEALGSPQQNPAGPPVTQPSDATSETQEEDEEAVHEVLVCHTAVESANVSPAVNGSLSCQWEDLTFLASLSWLHPHLAQLCWTESEVSYQSPELAFARAIWGVPTIQALCYWMSPEENLDDTLPPSTFELFLPLPSSGLGGEVDLNLTPSESLSGSESDCQTQAAAELPSDLAELDNLEEQLFSESNDEMEVNGGVVDDMIKLGLVVPPVTKPANPPPPQQQQKESVFVRLSNRIKVLERNMSLSSQYLEELSRRYKRQVDDMQKSLNRTLQVG